MVFVRHHRMDTIGRDEMGYSRMPILGEPNTCDNGCLHADCHATRQFVKTARCFICKMQILSGERYYEDDDGFLSHFRCEVAKK